MTSAPDQAIAEGREGSVPAGERLRLLDSAVLQSKEAILITDGQLDAPGPRVVFVNPAFTAMTGYSAAEIVGQTPRILQGPATDRAVLARLKRELAQGGSFEGNAVNYRKDGTAFALEWHIAPIRDDHGITTHFVAIQRDITERRRAEEMVRGRSLHEARRMDRRILQDLAIIVILLTAAFTVGDRSGVFEPLFARLALRGGALSPTADGVITAIACFALALVVFSYRRWRESRAEVAWQSQIGNALGVLHGELEAKVQRRTAEIAAANAELRREIAERRRAEAIINQFPAIIESSDDAILSKTLGGIITSWNAAAERMFGYAACEIIGQPITRLFPPDRLEEETAIMEQIRQGARVRHFETVRVRRDGRPLQVSVTISPIKDATGNIAGASKIIRDITERKQDQQQIAEQAALLDKARDAILVRDLEGVIQFWNQGAERIYGWSREEVVGRKASDFLYADPQEFFQFNSETLGAGEWSGEIRHRTKEDREITVEARWTLIRDAEGQPKSVLAINTDITERKKIEAQFLRAQRMESIGTLAGGIAHDLNNILAPIMMSIGLLRETATDPQAREILGAIDVSARRGADIVRQVLSFARGVEGERLEVRLKHLLNDLEAITRDTFPKDIRMSFSVPRDAWTIMGDPTQMHQILLNLCVNARDAMPHGGRLTIGAENLTLDEQYAAMNLQAQPGRYVVISVTDTGTGIPRELMDKIFEPFFTTKDMNKGTGLGLSTVMAIVKSHKGFVNVYSELNQGTTFKIYLPAAPEGLAGGPRGEEEASLPRGRGETVLVVDDEASILMITSQTLEAFGYKALTASNGADALAVYVQHQRAVAVVLTDMMMPVLDGPATIHALLRVNPTIKIIAASGLNANGDVARAAGAGVGHFLAKPYTASTLLTTIRKALDGR